MRNKVKKGYYIGNIFVAVAVASIVLIT